jgi:predicted DNA binding CopG/RHH family protein
MIDPDFDPLEQLENCQSEILNMSVALNRLIFAHNQREDLLQQLTDQHRDLIKMYKNLERRHQQLELTVQSEILENVIHGRPKR